MELTLTSQAMSSREGMNKTRAMNSRGDMRRGEGSGEKKNGLGLIRG